MEKTSKTPIADSLRDHGSKYYNHPRYDDKLIKAIEKLELENEVLREQNFAMNKTISKLHLLNGFSTVPPE